MTDIPTAAPQAPANAAAPTTEPPRPLIERRSAGTIDPQLVGGAPADAVKRFILTRAGFAPSAPEMAGLADLRLDDTTPGLARVPAVFPPVDYGTPDKPLLSVADWLACVDAVKAMPATPVSQ